MTLPQKTRGAPALAATAALLVGGIPGVWIGAHLSSRANTAIVRPALVAVLPLLYPQWKSSQRAAVAVAISARIAAVAPSPAAVTSCRAV